MGSLDIYGILEQLPAASAAPVSGTESDSDSIDIMTPPSHVSNLQATVVNPPLSAIAETASASGEDSEEEAEEGGWKTADRQTPSHNADEGVIKAGYLRKKGQRRKVLCIYRLAVGFVLYKLQ